MKKETISYTMNNIKKKDDNIVLFFADNIISYNTANNIIIVDDANEVVNVFKANTDIYSNNVKNPLATTSFDYDMLQYLTSYVKYDDDLIAYIDSLPISDEQKKVVKKYCSSIAGINQAQYKPKYYNATSD